MPTAREVALDVLVAVEQEGAYSNLELNRKLQQSGLAPSDAGLATELVYGTVARRNTLDYFAAKFVAKGMDKLEAWVRCLLRMSVYQLVYLDRIPDHAVVSEAVSLAKRRGHQGISGMVNGVLRSMLRQPELLQIPDNLKPAERISLEHSHPRWLVKRWIAQFGEATAEAICRANNEPPSVSVRVNTTMYTRKKLLEEMAAEGLQVEPSPLSPDGLIVRGAGNMALTSWYRDGIISIQDESSMLVARAVAPQPGMEVLDCCAAPGGKTTHMAELMQDQGHIVANDVHPHKQKLIEDQAERLGLDSIEVICEDALKLNEVYRPGTFDRILLDAPCSGFGVIRRKPDLRWSKRPEDVEEIADLQKELLETAASLVKPGGVLVYSTCTIEQNENAGQVDRFLAAHPEFSWAEPAAEERSSGAADLWPADAGLQILPQDYHSDGFYIARLRRRED
ncbi:16S rRNA (cytosine(967)-C(5))-methyltransferase RsmB [Paenibacillus sp. JX-17]|uniref:16S rRNA (cytosine(967)-C(5))-methyltransferase n=1 Tax=Paenibacillus lacisoli TaxID=3064525 RepID=A0ABT9CB77_9BACL|nr:16S rRNA (cytosine(967)-C(5))-methyltransferase RsmB [Paenibacillus sp. JX-17]MDO7905247.1 16S rRNA (cytosine(967)-C(5))-methyltransferase RsmB [Paenibacillus sp. JX-17]